MVSFHDFFKPYKKENLSESLLASIICKEKGTEKEFMVFCYKKDAIAPNMQISLLKEISLACVARGNGSKIPKAVLETENTIYQVLDYGRLISIKAMREDSTLSENLIRQVIRALLTCL